MLVRRRLTRLLLGGGALLLGCLLVWWARSGSAPSASELVVVRETEVDQIYLRGTASAATPELSAGQLTEPSRQLGESRDLRVRIVHAEGPRPVKGASVRLLKPAVAAPALGAKQYCGVVSVATTDADGLVVLPQIPIMPLLIEVSHLEYASRTLPVDWALDLFEIGLVAGCTARGRVVDPAGDPVPGITVVACAARLPYPTIGRGSYPQDAASMVTTRTDAFGAWEVRCGAQIDYQYAVEDVGWATLSAEEKGAQKLPDGSGGGETVIVAAPVRGFRMRFVHGSTRGLVVPHAVRVVPAPGALSGILRGEMRGGRWLNNGATWQYLPVSQALRGVYEGYVVFRNPDAAEQLSSLPMVVHKLHYRPTLVRIPLSRLDALAVSDVAHQIHLQPTDPQSEVGTLRVSCPYLGDAAVWKPPERILQVSASGWSESYRGALAGDNRWVFHGVPSGTMHVSMQTEDRITWTQSIEVDVGPGREEYVQLLGQKPTGVIIRAQDDLEQPVVNFRKVVLESEDPQSSGPLFLPPRLVHIDDSGKRLDSVIWVPPGEHRLRIYAPGLKPARSASFEVTAAAVTTVNVTMESGS